MQAALNKYMYRASKEKLINLNICRDKFMWILLIYCLHFVSHFHKQVKCKNKIYICGVFNTLLRNEMSAILCVHKLSLTELKHGQTQWNSMHNKTEEIEEEKLFSISNLFQWITKWFAIGRRYFTANNSLIKLVRYTFFFISSAENWKREQKTCLR